MQSVFGTGAEGVSGDGESGRGGGEGVGAGSTMGSPVRMERIASGLTA